MAQATPEVKVPEAFTIIEPPAPISLFEQCKRKVRQVFRFNWKPITVKLPELIQEELLRDWITMGKALPNGRDDIERIFEYFHEKTIKWDELSSDDFIMIMQLPEDEIPEFAWMENHCHLKFWTMKKPWSTWEKRLCNACYIRESQFWKPWSANYWEEKGITYTETNDHCIVPGEKLLEEFIWEPRNWCENCICAPLFRIFDEEDCNFFFGMHSRKRTFNCDNSDYSSDDDSDVEYCYNKTIKGNKIDNILYQFLKRNKELDN